MQTHLKHTLLLPFQKVFEKPWWIFIKECQVFIGSAFAPLSMGIIIFLCGMVSVLPHKTESSMDEVIKMIYHLFYVIVLIGGVVLAMSSFVSERRQGTLELMYTLPITDVQLVLGKFFMGIALILLIVLPMSIVYIAWLGTAPWYVVITGALGLFITGLYAYSVGLFASSLTDNYIVSLLVGILIVGIIDIAGFLAGLLPSPFREVISHLHGLNQFFAFTTGVIPIRGVIFFVSLCAFFLFLTLKVLESRRWRVRGN